MRKRISLFFIFFLGLISIAARDEDAWNDALTKVSSIVSILETNYYKNLDTENLAYSSIRGLLETLDPHSYFLEPKNYSRMREDYFGKYFGLGIQIQKQEDRLVVIAPIEGTPAWRLGIQPGDVISSINGESTKPLTSFDAMQRLRGERGTKVDITIVREGLNKPLELTVIREEIPLYSVPYAFMIDRDVGYVFIRTFAEDTDQELREKLSELIGQGMKKLILDLRGNTGGPLVSSIEISDEFLSKGALVVSIRGRNTNYNKDFKAARNDQYEKLPLIILINQGTASASEIVSGAVMDNDRGLIVGEDSWGKGLVQTIFPLSPNTAVAITTAKYLTPSGRSIQRDYSHIEDYMMAKQAPADSREIKYTLKGRKVLGQGGISPDYEVKTSINPLTAELMVRGTFFGFALKLIQHQTELSKTLIFSKDRWIQPGEGRAVARQSFTIGPRIIEDFKSYLRSMKVLFEEAAFKEAENEIKRELEREISSALWGVDEGVRVYRKSDPVVSKALEVMAEAARFVE